MSHVATVDLHVKDLKSLEKACKSLGLELVYDQKTYKWYGRSVGDYSVPEGFTAEELGKCEHAIRVPGNANAYEIGVVKRRDGQPGYQLMWDFFAGGYGMEKIAGKNCSNIKKEYAASVSTKQLLKQGFRVQRHVMTDGRIKISGVK